MRGGFLWNPVQFPVLPDPSTRSYARKNASDSMLGAGDSISALFKNLGDQRNKKISADFLARLAAQDSNAGANSVLEDLNNSGNSMYLTPAAQKEMMGYKPDLAKRMNVEANTDSIRGAEGRTASEWGQNSAYNRDAAKAQDLYNNGDVDAAYSLLNQSRQTNPLATGINKEASAPVAAGLTSLSSNDRGVLNSLGNPKSQDYQDFVSELQGEPDDGVKAALIDERLAGVESPLVKAKLKSNFESLAADKSPVFKNTSKFLLANGDKYDIARDPELLDNITSKDEAGNVVFDANKVAQFVQDKKAGYDADTNIVALKPIEKFVQDSLEYKTKAGQDKLIENIGDQISLATNTEKADATRVANNLVKSGANLITMKYPAISDTLAYAIVARTIQSGRLEGGWYYDRWQKPVSRKVLMSAAAEVNAAEAKNPGLLRSIGTGLTKQKQYKTDAMSAVDNYGKAVASLNDLSSRYKNINDMSPARQKALKAAIVAAKRDVRNNFNVWRGKNRSYEAALGAYSKSINKTQGSVASQGALSLPSSTEKDNYAESAWQRILKGNTDY